MITADKINSATSVALGFFDGVHRGHTSLINTAKEYATGDIKSVIYTLDTHPSAFFGSPVPMITSTDERLSVLKSMDTDYIYLQKTDRDFLNISPEDFVDEILVKRLNAAYVVSGENYTFGKNKSGNCELLKKLCDEKGIKYTVVPYLKEENQIISSSLIRTKLSEGIISDANKMLGRPFSLSGTVIHCRNVGHTLGFPTANILPPENIKLPMPGVYATTTIVSGKSYPSITNVGTAPTFSENKTIIESHILDFKEDIYSKEIKIEFIKLLRPQKKFSSAVLLSEQLKKDTDARRKI